MANKSSKDFIQLRLLSTKNKKGEEKMIMKKLKSFWSLVSAASFKRQIVGNRSKFFILKFAPDTDMNLSMSSATKNTIITVNKTKKLRNTFTLDYCLV